MPLLGRAGVGWRWMIDLLGSGDPLYGRKREPRSHGNLRVWKTTRAGLELLDGGTDGAIGFSRNLVVR
jgi:hypothetical protein